MSMYMEIASKTPSAETEVIFFLNSLYEWIQALNYLCKQSQINCFNSVATDFINILLLKKNRKQ